MESILLRAAEPERDFEQLAALFSTLEDEPTTAAHLAAYYEKEKKRINQKIAEDEQGKLLGFYWAVHDKNKPDNVYFYLFVHPAQRKQGVGRRLYDDLLQAVDQAGVSKLQAHLWDSDGESLAFAEQRGFHEKFHQLTLVLDLHTFDDRPFSPLISRLESEGFQFTSMEELGNTEEAQRMLYVLNDTTAMDVPGSSGKHVWDTFEDFQASVCQAAWYKPAGQFVAIDTTNNEWAAMCAITRMEGNTHANTLHIGVDQRYRGRKLGQAVRMLALRYARDVLKADRVFTYHTAQNLPVLAIDRKMGYQQMRGICLMERGALP